jgi:hypothetical protein
VGWAKTVLPRRGSLSVNFYLEMPREKEMENHPVDSVCDVYHAKPGDLGCVLTSHVYHNRYHIGDIIYQLPIGGNPESF